MGELTIGELLELINDAKEQGADNNTPVHISYNYGDHWRTTVAPLASEAEMTSVIYSDYHQMDKVADEDNCEELEKSNHVFVIS